MNAKGELKGLTSIRGIAALLIVYHHFFLLTINVQGEATRRALSCAAIYGMTLFFVLSGFVIHYTYHDRIQKNNGVTDFIIARIARLMPLYVVFIGINILINFFILHISPANIYAILIPINLIAAQSWFFGGLSGVPLHYSLHYGNVAWSISTEVLLYFFYIPILFIIIRHLTRKKEKYYLLILLSFMIVVRYVVFHYTYDGSKFGFWLNYISPYGRFFEFMAGVFIAEIFRSYNLFEKNRAYVLFLAIGFAALSCCNYAFWEIGNFTVLAYIGSFISSVLLIIYLTGLGECPTKFHAINDFFYRVGILSYSIYLLHSLLFPIFRDIDLPSSVRLILFTVILYFVSSLSYRFIEYPGKRLILTKLRVPKK